MRKNHEKKGKDICKIFWIRGVGVVGCGWRGSQDTL